METTTSSIYCLRGDSQDKGGHPIADEERKERTKPDEAIRCKACGLAVTEKDHKIGVNGSHSHTFFNPAGIVYELGCFRKAPGCHIAGEASSEFTWFVGHVWRFALCRRCNCHLGWLFEQGENSFYGLILTNLVE